MKSYQFLSAARQEYLQAGSYYAQVDSEIAGRFYEEIERLILEIRQDPQRFRIFEGKVRRHFSTFFPYAVLFLDRPGSIVIIAVMHMKRAPGY